MRVDQMIEDAIKKRSYPVRVHVLRRQEHLGHTETYQGTISSMAAAVFAKTRLSSFVLVEHTGRGRIDLLVSDQELRVREAVKRSKPVCVCATVTRANTLTIKAL
jgi:hypothetical protein